MVVWQIFVLFLLNTLTNPLEVLDECNSIECSYVVDEVCGLSNYGGVIFLERFHNLCHLMKARCHLKKKTGEYIKHVPNRLCFLKKRKNFHRTRRVTDFAIVGAHQPCNHTCPTFCVDTYEPACAQISTPHKVRKIVQRMMVNHCHIDLFSCSFGLNVTVTPLVKCFTNPAALMFMTEIVAMKSMKLLVDQEYDTVKLKQNEVKKLALKMKLKQEAKKLKLANM